MVGGAEGLSIPARVTSLDGRTWFVKCVSILQCDIMYVLVLCEALRLEHRTLNRENPGFDPMCSPGIELEYETYDYIIIVTEAVGVCCSNA